MITETLTSRTFSNIYFDFDCFNVLFEEGEELNKLLNGRIPLKKEFVITKRKKIKEIIQSHALKILQKNIELNQYTNIEDIKCL